MKRNKWAKKMAWLLVLLLVFSLMPASIQAEAKGRKTKLKNTKITMTVGKSKKIKLLNNSQKVKWSTSNKKVVKITKKSKKYVKVKALKTGTAKITAKVGTKKYTCKVTVKAKKGFFSTTEATTEEPKKPTTETVTEAPKKPTTEKPVETPNEPTTEKKTEDSKEPTTEEKTESTEKPTTGETTETTEKPTTEEATETTEKPATGGTTEKPTDPSEGTEDPTQRYTRLKWVELLLDSVGTKVITEEAVSKDPNGNALYSYVDLKEETANLTVETAVGQGILIPSEGQEEDVYFFYPEEVTTREFAAVTAARALGYMESQNAPECSDKESLEYPLWDAVAVNIGLIGLQDGCFNGREELTGADAKQMLAKIKEIKTEETAVPEKVVDIQYADDLVKDSVAGLTDYLVTETEIGYQITINNYTGTIEETGIEAGKPIYLPADQYEKYPDGFVCRVAGVEISGNQIHISGTPIESVFEVMDSFQLSGEAAIEEIILADGVTVKNAEDEESIDSHLSAESGEESDGLTEEEMDSKLASGTISLGEGELTLGIGSKKNDVLSGEIKMKSPKITYDIKCSKDGLERFKVVASNAGTLSLKADTSEITSKKIEIYKTKMAIDLGGGFEITPIFNLEAEVSGSYSWTMDVTADLGIDLQRENKIISNVRGILGENLGGNIALSLSAGPEIDIVLSWLNDDWFKLADLNLGYGLKGEITTASAADTNGEMLYCMERGISKYISIGIGDAEGTILNEWMEKKKLSISVDWNIPISGNHYESKESGFGPFNQVKKCTAAHNLHGAVLDKDGQKVKFDSIIIRSKENPEQEYRADNHTEGYYTCRVPDDDYEIIAVWDGVIKVRKDITVDGDSYYDIREGGIIDSGSGTGYSWSITEDGNFECEVDETADMTEVYKVMHSKESKDIGITSVYMYGTVGEKRLCGSNLTVSGLFYNMRGLVSVNLAELNTQNVTDMKGTFSGCTELEILELGNFDTSKVTDMSSMFAGCNNLTELDLCNFNTSKVTDMSGMFATCNNLTELDLCNFNTSKVTDMSSMFSGCSNLIELDLSSFNTSNVTNMSYMFSYLDNLLLDLSKFDTGKVTDMSSMFSGCSNLIELDLSSFNTSNVTNMSYMFSDCSNLIELDLSSFNTSNVTNMADMLSDCRSLTELDLGNFNTGNVADMRNMFRRCSNLAKLELNSFDTSNVVDMTLMFGECKSLTELDLSNFNTDNVTNMSTMFYRCSSLTKLDLSSFNTSNVADMSFMFSGCKSLIEVDVSNFVTSMETGMSKMFEDCHDEIIPEWYMNWCEYWSEYWNEDIS